MKVCVWCEGRKVTGHIIRGEDGSVFPLVGGNRVPMVIIEDGPCGVCGGTGEVTEEKHALLTKGPDNGR